MLDTFGGADGAWYRIVAAIGCLFDAVVQEPGTNADPDSRRAKSDARAAAELCREALNMPDAVAETDVALAVVAVLGKLLLDFPLGEAQRRIEEIISICSDRSADEPTEATKHMLGIINALMGCAYRSRLSGNHEENVATAIKHFHRTLQVSEFDDYRIPACVHHNLGALYTQQVREFRGRASALAVHHCRNALELFQKDDDPFRWAVIQSDLGLARLTGAHQEAEAALGNFSAALSVFTRDQHPRFWAFAHKRLGIAFLHRLRGKQSENRKAAIAHLEMALMVFSRGAWDTERALTLLELGRAYGRAPAADAENITRAIAALEEASDLTAGMADDSLLGTVQYSLGRAYFRRADGDNVSDLEGAVTCFRSALKLLDGSRRPAARSIAARELAAAEERLNCLTTGR